LAFPCAQFMNQEPGDEAAVCTFAATRYNAKFPIHSKIDVNGAKTAPVYAYLKKAFPGDITWNFSSKFIINRAGVPVRRFESESWEVIEKAVAELIAEPIPAGSAAAAAPAASADAAPAAPSPPNYTAMPTASAAPARKPAQLSDATYNAFFQLRQKNSSAYQAFSPEMVTPPANKDNKKQ